MKKLLISTFLFPAVVLISGRVNAQGNAFDWDVFNQEVTRFLAQASADGFDSWEGELVGTGPMGLFEAFACTESFMGGSGMLYKNPLGGYEFVIALQVDEASASETPSTQLQENYSYFTDWLATQGTAITTQKDEGYAGFSKIREGSSLNLEETLNRKWAALGVAIAYETSYVPGEGDKFQHGLVVTITSGYVEGEDGSAVEEKTTEEKTEEEVTDDENFWLYLFEGEEEEEEDE